MAQKKKSNRMPTGMYVGSAWIGFSILMFVCWVLAFIQTNYYVKQGIGDIANFMTILICIAIFGFGIPLMIGIRTLRRAGRQVQETEHQEKG